jgi:serine/threonine protein phosphatase 1
VTRHLAIGDIHGCINALRSLVDFVGFRHDDTIITLGDYVDRGPNSRAVLDLVIELGKKHNLIPLRGNHEIMMLDSREKESWLHAWMKYGGDATLRSYSPSGEESGSFADVPDSHIDFLENNLVSYYECEAHFFVHANVDAKIALSEQSDASLYWKKYRNPERHCSEKIMVCGHTAQHTGSPVSNDHSICIDTWAYGGGWLSCFDVESGMIWQANEAGDRRSFTVDQNLTARIDLQS